MKAVYCGIVTPPVGTVKRGVHGTKSAIKNSGKEAIPGKAGATQGMIKELSSHLLSGGKLPFQRTHSYREQKKGVQPRV